MRSASPGAGGRLGPYELVHRLGRGGMGDVWEAVLHGPAGFEKPVALKCLDDERLGDPILSEALIREARLGARLQHPNIVSTLSLSEHDGRWVVALELVRGASLSELMQAGPLPPGAALSVGVQCAAALAHAHQHGLVHRDVKLANVLVDATGLVKLVDLGISLLAGEKDQACGTPGYMAPEQIQGRVDPRSDLFALGVLLCRVSLCRAPFGRGQQALDAVQRVEQILQSDDLVESMDAYVPGLGQVVRRCLRFDPDDRWPDARSLGAALSALRTRLPPDAVSLPTLVGGLRPDWSSESTDSRTSDAPTQLLPVGNVPTARNRFVGRTAELGDLQARLLDPMAGLLTLLGPGGMGKTRLALEVARQLRSTFQGGAWVFDLTEARTEGGVCSAVARTLKVQLGASRSPADQVGSALAQLGRALVVLDNLEQCVEHLPETLGRWLDQAPDAVFLCTTRVRLQLMGEGVFALGPLEPEAAAALFVERMGRPLLPEEVAHVEPLCRDLDGLPLAVELAAARVPLLGVARVRERLSLSLLSGGGRERPERHRSLTASLDWSLDLLSPEAAAGVFQLSVFQGGFTLEAAEAVLDLPPGADALQIIGELVDASLLWIDSAGGRFGMLVVVREFASTRADSEERAAAELRHGQWYGQLGETEALQRCRGPGSTRWHRELGRELDNLAAACDRAIRRGDGSVAVRSLAAMWQVIGMQGPVAVIIALADRVLAMPVLSTEERAAALALCATALGEAGHGRRAVGMLQEALALHRQDGRRAAEARTLNGLGVAHHRLGDLEQARQLYEAALAVHQELGDLPAQAVNHANLGSVNGTLGRYDEALEHHEAGLALNRLTGVTRSEGYQLGNLGNLHMKRGNLEQARTHYEAALVFHLERSNRAEESTVRCNLARLLHRQGHLDEAEQHIELGIAAARDVGRPHMEAVLTRALAGIARDRGRPDEARTLLEAALASVRQTDHRELEATILGDLAVGLAASDPVRALAMLHEARGALAHLGDAALAVEVLAASAEVLSITGDRAGSLAALAAARTSVPPGDTSMEEHVSAVAHRLGLE